MTRSRTAPVSIQIDLTTWPRGGRTINIFRCHVDDKKEINEAARRLGMNAAQFTRICVIQAARKVIADLES